MSRAALLLAIALSMPAPGWANQAAILQIRVIEGDGAVQAAGTRASRPLVVRVTDETGHPVAEAAVSFRLPDDGPSGVFGNGLRSELALTAADGRASVAGLRVNRTTGSMQVRITASKGQARAGTVAILHISEASAERRASRKWMLLGAAGGATSGLVWGLSRGGEARPSAAEPPRIGLPTISLGPP